MSTTTTLFLWLFAASAVNLGFCYATTTGWSNGTIHQTTCIPSEREAPLEFKKHLKDPSNRHETWAADDADCCSWYGVSCHHHDDSTAQYVTGLHLRSLCFVHRDELQEFDEFLDYEEFQIAYKKTIFSCKISSVVLNLKHFRCLDLSCNDFGGVPIPSFLGSMGSLRFLTSLIPGLDE